MPRLRLLILPLVALALVWAPAAAAKKPACPKSQWSALIQDWYEDGRVDRKYAVPCYRAAIKHLPRDVQDYSSAPRDILDALQLRVNEIRRAKQEKARQKDDPEEGGATPPAPPGSGSTGTGSSGRGSSGPASPPPPPAIPPDPAKSERPKAEGGYDGGKQAPRPVHRPPEPAGSDSGGPIRKVFDSVAPSEADGIPIPLLVLAALALLLMFGGVAGFVSRRLKAGGIAVQAQPAQPAERR